MQIKKINILIVFLLLFCFTSFSQVPKAKYKSYGFLLGYQLSSSNFLDLGFAREFGTDGNPLLLALFKQRTALFFNGHRYFNIDLHYNPSNKVIGTDLGYNEGRFFALGLHLNYYNFKQDYKLGLKPEFGIIANRFQVFYGYNFKIAGAENNLLAKNSIRISCYFPVWGNMNSRTFNKR